MSYQVLARKWRPKRFSEMVGQQHVLKALENALNQDRLHHAYLFTGTRGVGKTTIARIFAKCLNCQSGVSAEPCGTCSICESVDQGRFLDLMEIDAASHTGVDSIRELLDNTQYTPTQGKYKVYLIDEVHMLSSSSFNALLKTLEEPPEHVKFLLATTDPQKLPVTVLSRCLQFNLKAMSASQISEHLKLLLEKEMISFEDEALDLIAKSADGSMRDALSLADQAIAHGNENLQGSEVRAMLGLVDRAYIAALLDALLAKDAQNLLNVVEQIAGDSPNYQSVLAELISYFHRLIVQQVSGIEKDSKVKELAQSFTAEDLQLFYQIALKGRQDLSISPDPRQGMEICLLRMLLFKPDKLLVSQASSAVLKVPNSITEKGAKSSSSSTNSAGQGHPQQVKNNAKAHFDPMRSEMEKKNTKVNTSNIGESQDLPVKHQVSKPAIDKFSPKVVPSFSDKSQVVESNTQQVAEKVADKYVSKDSGLSSSNTLPNNGPHNYSSIADKWTQIVLGLELKGPALMVAKNSNLNKVADREYVLTLDRKFEMLASVQALKVICDAMNQFYGSKITLSLDLSTPDKLTPEQHFLSVDRTRSQLAAQSILKDEVVIVLQKEFSADIQEGSSKLLH